MLKWISCSQRGKTVAQQHETTTDRLVGIIANLKLERRSGRLTVRRGEGLTAEEGTLLFVQGQVTQANVGRRSGPDALNWLSTWRQARYIFTPTDAGEEAMGASVLLPPALPSPNGNASHAVPPAAQSNGSRWDPPQINANRSNSAHPDPPAYEVPYGIVELATATALMDRSGLPRLYRRLYLLIDGYRSVAELAPLLGRTIVEVRAMLRNLESLGIIRLIYPPPES